jgi:hypothetical protein
MATKKSKTAITIKPASKEKLPVAFKKKFVSALRSGDYTQGSSALRAIETVYDEKKKKEVSKATYCCLGVACHIAGATGITDKAYVMNEKRSVIKSINKVPSLLQGEDGIPQQLASMNDSGKTFAEIADWIETNL